MLALLSRREKQLLRKFQMGYTAWARPQAGLAHLVPGLGVIGKHERVRTDLLVHMTALGYLSETQDVSPCYGIRGDIHWESK